MQGKPVLVEDFRYYDLLHTIAAHEQLERELKYDFIGFARDMKERRLSRGA